MAEPVITLPVSTLAIVDMDVESKIDLLTSKVLSSESIYMRAKDTFKELLDGRSINETEYAQFASQFITQLATTSTQQVITSAIQWAQQELDMSYNLASVKAQTDLTLAQIEKIKAEIAKLVKDEELQRANITSMIASSIRKNGRPLTYGADGYTPLSLMDEGSEYIQIKALEAQTYSTLSDSYRKSGNVEIGTGTDNIVKGIAGTDLGYTVAQEKFALRQVKSFEDSKRNHAANASSQMIGQLLSQEIAPDPTYVAQWNAAMTYLNTPTA